MLQTDSNTSKSMNIVVLSLYYLSYSNIFHEITLVYLLINKLTLYCLKLVDPQNSPLNFSNKKMQVRVHKH